MSSADTTEPTQISEIFQRANERAVAASSGYAGLVTPTEAHALWKAGAAKIVDVRTRFENDYVGRVADTVQVPLVEWNQIPTGKNPDFLQQLAGVARPDEHIMFLCRSGARSHAAALAAKQAGYQFTYNILEGFEGDLDEHKHRNSVNGWRKAGLPWVQG